MSRYLSKLNRFLSAFDNGVPVGGSLACHPPLFILGVPRSGTTLAYQLLTQQLNVGYFSSPMNYLYGAPKAVAYITRPLTGRPKNDYSSSYGHIRGMLAPTEHPGFWLRWFPEDAVNGHYVDESSFSHQDATSLYDKVCEVTRIQRRPMVFKCLYLDMNIGLLAKAIPQAHFIVVERDLLPLCQSLIRARERQKNPLDWWSVKIPGYRDLNRLPVWEQVVTQVCSVREKLEHGLAKLNEGRYLRLKYEHICDNPRATIEEVSQWMSPHGYEKYEDWRSPENFTVSANVTLSGETTSKIRNYVSQYRCN